VKSDENQAAIPETDPGPGPLPRVQCIHVLFFSYAALFFFDVFAQKKKKRKPGRHFWVVCFFFCCFGSRGGLAGPQRPLSGSSILVAPRWFTIFEVRGLIRMQSTTSGFLASIHLSGRQSARLLSSNYNV